MTAPRIRRLLLGACTWLGLLSSALAGPAGTWPVQATRSHVQCPWRLEGPQARVFTSARHWEEIMSVPEAQAVGVPVDYRFDHLVVFGLETQRTLGVKVQFEQPVLELQGRDARMAVRVTRPRRGDMVAAALSRPCVVAKVPKRAWRVLEVRDGRTGGVLYRAKVRSRH